MPEDQAVPQNAAEEGDEDEENEDGLYYDSDEEAQAPGTVKLSEMTKEQRKEHKAKVKEENREKRKNKVPKHIKKKAMSKNKKP